MTTPQDQIDFWRDRCTDLERVFGPAVPLEWGLSQSETRVVERLAWRGHVTAEEIARMSNRDGGAGGDDRRRSLMTAPG